MSKFRYFTLKDYSDVKLNVMNKRIMAYRKYKVIFY